MQTRAYHDGPRCLPLAISGGPSYLWICSLEFGRSWPLWAVRTALILVQVGKLCPWIVIGVIDIDWPKCFWLEQEVAYACYSGLEGYGLGGLKTTQHSLMPPASGSRRKIWDQSAAWEVRAVPPGGEHLVLDCLGAADVALQAPWFSNTSGRGLVQTQAGRCCIWTDRTTKLVSIKFKAVCSRHEIHWDTAYAEMLPEWRHHFVSMFDFLWSDFPIDWRSDSVD